MYAQVIHSEIEIGHRGLGIADSWSWHGTTQGAAVPWLPIASVAGKSRDERHIVYLSIYTIICIYIYIHYIYIYIYIYLYVYIYIYVYMYVYTHEHLSYIYIDSICTL